MGRKGSTYGSQASPSTVRNPEGSIYLYTKGADTVIFERLQKKDLYWKEQTVKAATEEALTVSPVRREGAWVEEVEGKVCREMVSGAQGSHIQLTRLCP